MRNIKILKHETRHVTAILLVGTCKQSNRKVLMTEKY